MKTTELVRAEMRSREELQKLQPIRDAIDEHEKALISLRAELDKKMAPWRAEVARALDTQAWTLGPWTPRGTTTAPELGKDRINFGRQYVSCMGRDDAMFDVYLLSARLPEYEVVTLVFNYPDDHNDRNGLQQFKVQEGDTIDSILEKADGLLVEEGFILSGDFCE